MKKSNLPVILPVLSLAALAALGCYIGKRSGTSLEHAEQMTNRAQAADASLKEMLGYTEGEGYDDGLIEILTEFDHSRSSESLSAENENDRDALTAVPVYDHDELIYETDGFPWDNTEIMSETSGSDAEYYRIEDYPIPADHQIIFVGDSRTVGMGTAERSNEDSCLFIGESGEGYDWFAEFGLPALEQAIDDYPDAPVVFNLGVNDCDAVEAYIALYLQILNDHKDTDFYFMSVNPVTEESIHVPDTDVQSFNARILETFGTQYIDTYTWMTTYGYVSTDGVHYSDEQYRAIHDYAVRAISGLKQPETGLTEADSDES